MTSYNAKMLKRKSKQKKNLEQNKLCHAKPFQGGGGGRSTFPNNHADTDTKQPCYHHFMSTLSKSSSSWQHARIGVTIQAQAQSMLCSSTASTTRQHISLYLRWHCTFYPPPRFPPTWRERGGGATKRKLNVLLSICDGRVATGAGAVAGEPFIPLRIAQKIF